ncbi:ankyrin repeat-containing protein BDA1-like [Corylus avellana]|uniref:ankyrin repeat-containing protein BDA1-like n=1 Tax=Corylus avellana TaxID=13451 RepID=UPI00286CCEFF|nr:ankyrin repeat-containing protein BDA1-like [Corylus avellana]
MDQKLRDAAEQGDIDALYSLIEIDTEVLNKIDEISFVQTPLHVAADAGQTEFAMEMMMLKPSFAKKLNPNGFTPLLLAMHNNQDQLVRELLTTHKDLVCAQGKGGMNPLHYAAQTGHLRLLANFLKFYPKCIRDVTSRKETALHVALKNDKLDAFQVLVGWLRRAWFEEAKSWGRRLLNVQDLNGNTVLHIAASKNQPQVVRWILDLGARVNFEIFEGFTALDIAVDMQTQVDNQEMRNMLCRAGAKSASSRSTGPFADYLRSPIPINEKLFTWFFRQRTLMSNDMRNMLLVVAVLLVTIAYQSALSPPGGFWQDNQFNTITNASSEVSQPPHRAGTLVLFSVACVFWWVAVS